MAEGLGVRLLGVWIGRQLIDATIGKLLARTVHPERQRRAAALLIDLAVVAANMAAIYAAVFLLTQ